MVEKLLLVDDEEGIRKFLGLFLKDLGYEVTTAANGDAALAVLDEADPDIVLTDIKMPGMDGVELLGRIKERRPETEVIMITGHGDMDMAIKSLKLDAADFITKPINDELLEASLGRVREKLSMKRQLAAYTERLEDLVREKTALHQQLLDEAPCYICVVDTEGGVTSANRHFRAKFGDENGNAVRSLCHRLSANPDKLCRNCPVSQTLADGEPHQLETVVAGRDGASVNVLMWTTPIRSTTGELTHVMELSTDITELRALQDNLASLGLMISSMSHGVKGLLTALDGGIYRMESGMKRGDEVRVAGGFSTVKDIVDRIKRMVLDMLYYAKKRDLEWETVDAARFACRIADAVVPKAEQNGVAFSSHIAEDAGMFEVDEAAFAPALVNILENGVDACTGESCKLYELHFSVTPEPGHVVFTITDNGMGMTREVREKMFTLFFSSKGKKGTGLGMFISNQVVERHGGSIEVTSAPGEGATFTIRMPRTISEALKAAENLEPEGARA